jgi:hypothetical protein
VHSALTPARVSESLIGFGLRRKLVLILTRERPVGDTLDLKPRGSPDKPFHHTRSQDQTADETRSASTGRQVSIARRGDIMSVLRSTMIATIHPTTPAYRSVRHVEPDHTRPGCQTTSRLQLRPVLPACAHVTCQGEVQGCNPPLKNPQREIGIGKSSGVDLDAPLGRGDRSPRNQFVMRCSSEERRTERDQSGWVAAGDRFTNSLTLKVSFPVLGDASIGRRNASSFCDL